jgi:hypothetical protein
MVATQLAMVAVMTGTPIHMRDHGHGLGATGMVIGLHIAAMFLPSPLTGRLADRYGSRPVIAAAGSRCSSPASSVPSSPASRRPGWPWRWCCWASAGTWVLLGGTTLLSGRSRSRPGPAPGARRRRRRPRRRHRRTVQRAGRRGRRLRTLSWVSGVLAVTALAVALRPPAAARQGRAHAV